MANNHIKDLGKKGFKNTIRELKRNKIKYIGAMEEINEIESIYRFEDFIFINLNLIGVKKLGIPIHLYSATKDSFGSAYVNFKRLKNIVSKYKRNGKKVVLIIHGGKQLPKNSKDLNIDFESLKNLKSDITIIHHPHIYIETKWEKENIFVLGDFIFKSKDNLLRNDRKSAFLELEFKRKKLNVNLNKFRVDEIYRYE